mmetsp:Transcript_19499/g.27768  ORF Transcript_19499/g.27768 Transcript_19499/m.27768 type:complete len:305 (+) Transcript_19499:132-1046(+)
MLFQNLFHRSSCFHQIRKRIMSTFSLNRIAAMSFSTPPSNSSSSVFYNLQIIDGGRSLSSSRMYDYQQTNNLTVCRKVHSSTIRQKASFKNDVTVTLETASSSTTNNNDSATSSSSTSSSDGSSCSQGIPLDTEEEEEEDGDTNNIFAALPPIGASSFWDRKDDNDETPNNTNLTSHNIAVSRKFHLSYTCKICDTRNSHSITRLGYNKGVVIAVCKCCDTKHLIADNLGWSNYLVSGFDYDGGERNIEDHMKNRLVEESGGEYYDGASLRVDRSVFDLESLWHEEKDENSGALVIDEDGEDWS